MSRGEIVESFVVPVHPHTVLAPEQNLGWGRLRQAYDDAAKIIETSGADLLVIYSTTWPSIIGHQLISDPNPEWVMVDHDFHDLGSIRYSFNIDAEFAKLWNEENKSRGLQSRCVNYHGFPIDVGSVVALTLLNPDNKIPAVIVSSNVYADRSETTVLAKACKELVKEPVVRLSQLPQCPYQTGCLLSILSQKMTAFTRLRTMNGIGRYWNFCQMGG